MACVTTQNAKFCFEKHEMNLRFDSLLQSTGPDADLARKPIQIYAKFHAMNSSAKRIAVIATVETIDIILLSGEKATISAC